jgi:hypothetical protein
LRQNNSPLCCENREGESLPYKVANALTILNPTVVRIQTFLAGKKNKLFPFDYTNKNQIVFINMSIIHPSFKTQKKPDNTLPGLFLRNFISIGSPASE